MNTNKIKVTAEYETPKTDKFYALLSEYGKVKKLSDETVSYYKPLADAAGEKKIELILDQLNTIIDYAEQIHNIDQNFNYFYTGFNWGYGFRKFEFKYINNEWVITLDDHPFTKDKYLENRKSSSFFEYLIAEWDRLRIYEQLEARCTDELNYLIKKQKERAEKQENRLKELTK